MKEDNSKHRAAKVIRWIARIWSVPIIIYTLIMVIGTIWNWAATGVADPYAVEDVSPWESLPPILLAVSTVGLGLSWRWERLGGIFTLFFQLLLVISLLILSPITIDFPRMAIPYFLSVVVIIPAVLFLVSHRFRQEFPQ